MSFYSLAYITLFYCLNWANLWKHCGAKIITQDQQVSFNENSQSFYIILTSKLVPTYASMLTFLFVIHSLYFDQLKLCTKYESLSAIITDVIYARKFKNTISVGRVSCDILRGCWSNSVYILTNDSVSSLIA